MGKGCQLSEVIAGMGQIHPKMNREGLARFVRKTGDSNLSAPGMAHLLPQILSTRILEIARGGSRLYTPDCAA
jgi:hypothetical protein